MRIINPSGMEIPENVINEIVLELFGIVKKKFESKKKLPERTDLVGFLLDGYKEKYSPDLICAGQIEEVMEKTHSKELKEMGYQLLNKYNPDWFK